MMNNLVRRLFVFIFFTFLLLLSENIFAKNVGLITAQKVALNAFSKSSGLSKASLQIKETIPVDQNGELVYTIFNFNPNGFIIISADDATVPVLGYGLDSNFSFSDAPPGLFFLLKGYKNEIKIIKEKKLIANETITKEWEQYSSDQYLTLKSYTIGNHLLGTNWGQGSPYNQSCPLDPNTGKRCLAGCTAVALGQILNYWNCRVFPDGSTTYYPNGYFTNPLTVNFYNQVYDWGNMNTVPSVTAQLLYHCGVAIEVCYTDSATGGYSSLVEYAMENKFGLQTSGLKSKDGYASSTWIDMIKADINAGRPVYYDGTDDTVTPTTAHAWVVDGYDANNAFHCNWGWNGSYQTTFFPLTGLTPGSHNYNASQHAIFGIEPALDACSGLSGSDVICSSNTSYSISIPSTASVVWSKTGNLTQVGSNTGNTYTVYATSPSGGAGSITATIKNSQGQTFLTRTKSVWGGTPVVSSLSGTSPIGVYQPANYYLGISDNLSSPDSYSWGTSPLPGVSITSYGNYASIMFTQSGYYQVVGKAHNVCGWSDYGMKMVTVISGYKLAISPNPSSSESTISLLSENSEAVQLTTDWTVEVFDSTQGLKEKKTKLKTTEKKINTSGWKEGVYIVRATIADKVITEKMIVKH